jgi:hypothetical protein
LGLAEDDALEKGFQLAYFIVPSRTQAVEVLAGALNKLSLQRRRESRRAYWRDKYLKRGITRISRQEADALQWLILFESDRFEKEQESRGEQTMEEMAVRYIKSLVRITTAMSSFYVNVGLNRLLHNYTTAEIQRVYETVTDRYLGADEYRRAKSVLMTKLERRFGQLLRTFRTQYGELRFEAWDDQEPWRTLAERCLQALTPWSTAGSCPLPADFGPENNKIPAELAAARKAKITQDQLETNRCHAFIDPACYARLIRALALDPPEQRLALPRFFMNKQKGENKSDPPTPLTPEERKILNDRLSRESKRRRDSSAECIRVVIDGTERIRMDVSRQKACSLEIEEGAEMIELLAESQGEEDVLLAAHRISYTEAQGMVPAQTTAAVGANSLLLNITPDASPVGDQPHRAMLRLTYEAGGASIRYLNGRAFWSFSKYAAGALALLAIGWVAGFRSKGYHPETETRQAAPSLLGSPIPSASSSQLPSEKETSKLAAAYKAYTLVPDEELVRGAGGPESITVALPRDPPLVRLDLPIPSDSSGSSFLVTLKLLPANTVLLTETLPRNTSASGRVLALWVPTRVLREDKEYSIAVRAAKGGRAQEELSSYTFRTVAPKNQGGNANPNETRP